MLIECGGLDADSEEEDDDDDSEDPPRAAPSPTTTTTSTSSADEHPYGSTPETLEVYEQYDGQYGMWWWKVMAEGNFPKTEREARMMAIIVRELGHSVKFCRLFKPPVTQQPIGPAFVPPIGRIVIRLEYISKDHWRFHHDDKIIEGKFQDSDVAVIDAVLGIHPDYRVTIDEIDEDEEEEAERGAVEVDGGDEE